MTDAERQIVRAALLPLSNIYQAFLDNNLDDEARRFWGVEGNRTENTTKPEHLELYAGRGGNPLLNLAHCKNAYELLKKLG